MWKVIGNRFGAVAIGLLLVFLLLGPGNDHDAASCNGRNMRPGETCLVMRNGSSHRETYEQRQDERNRAWAMFLGLSVALVLGGAVVIFTRPPSRRTVFIQL